MAYASSKETAVRCMQMRRVTRVNVLLCVVRFSKRRGINNPNESKGRKRKHDTTQRGRCSDRVERKLDGTRRVCDLCRRATFANKTVNVHVKHQTELDDCGCERKLSYATQVGRGGYAPGRSLLG